MSHTGQEVPLFPVIMGGKCYNVCGLKQQKFILSQ